LPSTVCPQLSRFAFEYRDIFYDGTRACPQCITSDGTDTIARWDKPDISWSLQCSPESVVVCFSFFIMCGGLNAYRGAFAQRKGAAAAKIRALQVAEQERATAKIEKRLAKDGGELSARGGHLSARLSSRASKDMETVSLQGAGRANGAV
jgi:hypothetical protein